jgi:osmotically-inducible protein OsmY
MPRSIVALHRPALVTAVIVMSLAIVSGTPARRRVDAVAAESAALPAQRTLESARPNDAPRAADRMIERQVRRAIRADPSLVLAVPRVKVTSRHGVVRLMGQVRTGKDRSSIAFKAGQSAWGGRVDNRLTIGDGASS